MTKPTGNPRGRPKGVATYKKKDGTPTVTGERAIMADLRRRVLNSPKSEKVIRAIFDAALDDNHKNQAAAWKLLMERMVPVAGFEKELGGGRSAITVNITGVPGVEISQSGPDIEGDYEQIDDE